VRQISNYLEQSNLMPTLQSAYRQGHSTETALLKVVSDVSDAMDRGKLTLLGMLDISAAFDTVDHDILLKRLEIVFGLSGTVASWIKSFLTDRAQMVLFKGKRSPVSSLEYGVPQGSVLGPLLYLLYTAEVIDLAQSMGVEVHAYADDIQLYIHCLAGEQAAAMEKMSTCILEIGNWMATNRLRLNADKTKVMWLGSRLQLDKLRREPINIDNSYIEVSNTAKVLGVTLDEQLTFKQHIKNLKRSCMYQIRQLRFIRRYLTKETAAILIHAFVLSRIDYCNSLYAGCHEYIYSSLQSILNAAARLVCGVPRYDHITSWLKQLHWLPAQQRTQFKLAVLSFRGLTGYTPIYLTNMLKPVATNSHRPGLRSLESGNLVKPKVNTKKLVLHSFRISAPLTWNSLPSHLRTSTANNISLIQFRKQLKTHLFSLSYN
jgi:hypothetical protein